MFFFGHTQRYCYGDADVYHFVFCLSSQSLDLTSKRMIHEGPLTWKVSKDKTLGKKSPPHPTNESNLIQSLVKPPCHCNQHLNKK